MTSLSFERGDTNTTRMLESDSKIARAVGRAAYCDLLSMVRRRVALAGAFREMPLRRPSESISPGAA